MKKVYLITALVFSGCSMAGVNTERFNPETNTVDTCSASYSSLFKSSDDINMNACGEEGAGGGASGSQTTLSEALTNALIKGISGM